MQVHNGPIETTEQSWRFMSTSRGSGHVYLVTVFVWYSSQKESINTKFIFLRVDYSLVKINIDDILLIEGLDDYLQIFLPDQKKVVPRMTMKGILGKLPSEDFIRVHRSFIVPIKQIEQVRNKTIFLNGRQIPMGASYEEAFLRALKK